MEKRIPEEGEYVIVRIKEISPNSAIVNLEEYDSVSGFVHLSEIANCWIKDIKKFIKPNQVKVAKILRSDPNRSYMNLSFKRVPQNIAREREKEYKTEQKANNLLKMLVEKYKVDRSFKEIKSSFLTQFYSVKEAFEYLSSVGVDKFSKEFKLDKKLTEELHEVVKKSIEKKQVHIDAVISIKIYEGNGIEQIKEILNINEEKVEINYVSAPNYSLKIIGKTYPYCEKKYKELTKYIMDYSNSKKNSISINRIKNK